MSEATVTINLRPFLDVLALAHERLAPFVNELARRMRQAGLLPPAATLRWPALPGWMWRARARRRGVRP